MIYPTAVSYTHLQKRQGQFYNQFVAALIEEANKLHMTKDEIISLIERGFENECNSN